MRLKKTHQEPKGLLRNYKNAHLLENQCCKQQQWWTKRSKKEPDEHGSSYIIWFSKTPTFFCFVQESSSTKPTQKERTKWDKKLVVIFRYSFWRSEVKEMMGGLKNERSSNRTKTIRGTSSSMETEEYFFYFLFFKYYNTNMKFCPWPGL